MPASPIADKKTNTRRPPIDPPPYPHTHKKSVDFFSTPACVWLHLQSALPLANPASSLAKPALDIQQGPRYTTGEVSVTIATVSVNTELADRLRQGMTAAEIAVATGLPVAVIEYLARSPVMAAAVGRWPS